MNEKVLGHFLSYKRSILNPADYQIKTSTRRRVAGLTRDEVAELSNISADWYTRLEQGRENSTPSSEVLSSLASVLKLNLDEREYIFNLVNSTDNRLDASWNTTTTFQTDIQRLLDNQLPNIAFFTDQNLTIKAFNETAQGVYHFQDSDDELHNNLIWRTFNDKAVQKIQTDWETYAVIRTAQFRYIYSRDADSSFLFKVFEDIKENPYFQRPWDNLKVEGLNSHRLLMNIANIGQLYLSEMIFKYEQSNGYLFVQSVLDEQSRRLLENKH